MSFQPLSVDVEDMTDDKKLATLPREHATTKYDLPHVFELGSYGIGQRPPLCMCGEAKGHDLHTASVLPEMAAARPSLVREKGI